MRNFLTSYFYYSRGERNGIVVLAALSLCFLMSPKIYSLMNKQNNNISDFSGFEKEIMAFVSHNSASDTEGASFSAQTNESVLFPFNPNNATKEDLMRLGLSPKVATTFIHFREKGGRFFKKEDVKKIYGIKESDYARLEDYIELENSGTYPTNSYGRTPQYGSAKNEERTIALKPFDPNSASENDLLSLGLDVKTVKILLKYREKGGYFKTKEDLRKVYGLSDIDYLRINAFVQITENQAIAKNAVPNASNNNPSKQEISPIDLNQANIENLLQLRGIGRTFATRIIEHRERLGGFSSLNQLKEVYGLPDSTLRNITPFLRLSSSPHRKIQVNKSTIEEFSHPYLTRKQVEAIVRYRVNHGNFKNMEDLKKTGVLNEIMAEKLKPYLIFD